GDEKNPLHGFPPDGVCRPLPAMGARPSRARQWPRPMDRNGRTRHNGPPWEARPEEHDTMPELPDVETVRRGLEPAMVGAGIAAVDQRRPDLRFPFPERFAERLRGRTVISLGRRAKYLMADLSGGDILVMHLGMTGRFIVEEPGGALREPCDFYQEAGRNAA